MLSNQNNNSKCKKSQVPDWFIYPDLPSKCTWKKPTERNPHSNRAYAGRTDVLPNILHAIGNTPLVKLNKIPQSEGIKCEMYAKCEFLNPGGSVKDRIGYRMIEDAESEGRLGPGYTVIEATSGNTGIGVAMACAVKGYDCIIVMPTKMSNEKVNALKALGAKIVRTPTEAAFDSPEGLIAVAQRINREIPKSIIMGQYTNSGNPLVHYDCTAEEILKQCAGKIDMVVIGVGTGGTISGVGRRIKETFPKCQIVGIDPIGSILAKPDEMNKEGIGFYEIEGLGYDFVPTVLDHEVVDKWYKSNDKESFLMARRINREEGLLSGGSSGSALLIALKAARDLKEGDVCVVILPDGIRNYMTKFVSENWMEARHFMEPINEFDHWWWTHSVSELKLSETISIRPDVKCSDALKILKDKKAEHLAIIGENGSLYGTITLADITTKLVSQNQRFDQTVDTFAFKQFRKVTKTAQLGLISRILEKDNFLVIVDDDSHKIVTRMDLLDFISNELNNE